MIRHTPGGARPYAMGINFSKKKIGCYRPVAALSDWFDQKSLTMMSKKKDLRLTPSIDPKELQFFFQWSLNYQPKQFIREIPQIYDTFALLDPSQMGPIS